MGMITMMHPYESYCFNKYIHACYWVLAMVLYNLTSICPVDFPFIGVYSLSLDVYMLNIYGI